jgi:hypothetical protein
MSKTYDTGDRTRDASGQVICAGNIASLLSAGIGDDGELLGTFQRAETIGNMLRLQGLYEQANSYNK